MIRTDSVAAKCRGRDCPGHPLRPNRSPLRAPQGCAPDQANKSGDAVGRGRQESSFLEHPGATFFREKRKALTGKKKNQEPEPQKRNILIEVRKGTFLKSFNTDRRSRLNLVAGRFTVPNVESRCNQLKLGHPPIVP